VILWTFRERPWEPLPSYACATAHRYVLTLNLTSIAFEEHGKSRATGEWSHYWDRFAIWLRWRRLRFGFDCFYYDGPHHSFSIGPIQFCWFDGRCPRGQRCGAYMKDDE
jgi:hypothetical protein